MSESVDASGKPYDTMANMSLRDWFAGMAMQSLIRLGSAPARIGKDGELTDDQPFYFGYWDPMENELRGVDSLANDAYTVADAMLKERDK